MLKGAIDTLEIGNPEYLSTDIGPVIDKLSKEKIINHTKNFMKIYSTKQKFEEGYFVPVTIIEIASLNEIKDEVFGPVVHIIPYKNKRYKKLCKNINLMGYGLTLGIHSRIDNTINTIVDNINVGNIYINRNMVGAVVGGSAIWWTWKIRNRSEGWRA